MSKANLRPARLAVRYLPSPTVRRLRTDLRGPTRFLVGPIPHLDGPIQLLVGQIQFLRGLTPRLTGPILIRDGSIQCHL
jgi:hypothetical protein